jgi:hypothetical protein
MADVVQSAQAQATASVIVEPDKEEEAPETDVLEVWFSGDVRLIARQEYVTNQARSQAVILISEVVRYPTIQRIRFRMSVYFYLSTT